MKTIARQSLLKLQEELGTLPEALLREIAGRCAEELAVVHDAGAVHGRLNPRSVLLGDDGRVRLLGLTDAEAIDPAPDLASLGAMLRALAPADSTPFLAAVLDTLRDGGFESAAAAHAVLADGENSAWWAAREPEAEPAAPRVGLQRETDLYGREATLRELGEAWLQAQQGTGSTVILEGRSGIGKTRLIAEFLEPISGPDVHVLYGAYPPSGGLGGISDAILGKFGVARLEESLAPYLTQTSELVPGFAAAMKHESPPDDCEPVRADAFGTVTAHLLRALAAERPTIWVVDDLHFAPAEAHTLALALARAVEAHRVLLLIATRPGIALDDFLDTRNSRVVSLGRLGDDAVTKLLRESGAEGLDRELATKANGVPFLLLEMIRGLRDGRFESAGDALPSSMSDLVAARLRDLDDRQRAILEVGAVQGIAFDPALVATVVDESLLNVLRDLAYLERELDLVRAEGSLVRFAQNQMPEVIYLEMMPDLRSEYHALLAEATADTVEEMSGEATYFLASHHLRGSRPAKALPYLDAALLHLNAAHRHEAALALLEQALRRPGVLENRERARLLLYQAERLGRFGRRRGQRTAIDEALAIADDLGEADLQAQARADLALHYCDVSDNDAAEATLTEALEYARSANAVKQEGRIYGILGGLAYNLSRYDESIELHERHLELARRLDDRGEQGVANSNLGNVYFRLGQYEKACACHRTFLKIGQETGNRTWETVAHTNLGPVLLGMNHVEEAREHHERALELARRIGYRHAEAIALGNLGGVYENRGRWADSIDCHERQLALGHETADRQAVVLATANLGLLRMAMGKSEDAHDYLNHSLEVCRTIGERRGIGFATHRLGQLAEQQGQLEKAQRLYEDALALRRELGNRVGIVETLLALGRLLAKRGQVEEADRVLAESLSQAQQLASPSGILMAVAYRATLPDADPAELRELLEGDVDGLGVAHLMEAWFCLWRASGDRTHLAQAYERLVFLRDHAPADCIEAIMRDVPLHRAIVEAWALPPRSQ